MIASIQHYRMCHTTCYCTGCQKGLRVTVWLQLLDGIRDTAKAIGNWAYRMEMRQY